MIAQYQGEAAWKTKYGSLMHARHAVKMQRRLHPESIDEDPGEERLYDRDRRIASMCFGAAENRGLVLQ